MSEKEKRRPDGVQGGGAERKGEAIAFPQPTPAPDAPQVPDFLRMVEEAAAEHEARYPVEAEGHPAEEQAAPQEQASVREFSFLTAEDVLALKTPPWRVKDVLPAVGLAAIFGQSGSGKTFIALDMAFAMAEGRDWFQMQTHPCPVVYVNLESNLGLKKRLTAWQKERARPVPDNVRFVIEPFHILEDVAALARGIEPGAVIFLDTLNAASAGLDENSSRDMGLILEEAKKLQRLTEGLVVLIHHGGKDATKGLRGHSSLNAALDTAIEVSRNGESRSWRTSKAKEAEDGRRHGFRLKSVVIGYTEENEPESSCVIEPDDTPVQEEERLPPALVYGLETLRTALKGENADAVHLEAWRKYFYAGHTADNTHAKKVAFQRARQALMSQGKIAVDDDLYSLPGTSAQDRHKTGTCAAAHVTDTGTPGTHTFRCVPGVPVVTGTWPCRPLCRPDKRQGDIQETDGRQVEGRAMPDVLSFLPCPERFKRKGPHEWAGPCPACGGKDRFLVWPERPRGGAYLCRGCGAQGDGIQFLREFMGMSYPEACAALGLTPKDSRTFTLAGGKGLRRTGTKPGHDRDNPVTYPAQGRHTARHTTAAEQFPPPWPPPPVPAELPPAAWSRAAAAFLADCQKGLETDVDAVLALAGRYLTPDTARACGLGWNPADRYECRDAWGLPPVEGREKLLLPRGLVIATRRRSGVVGLTVRCPDNRPEGRPKYRQVAGSANVPFVAGRGGAPVVLMESGLDGALLWQETGGQCAAVAFMGSSKPVDADTAAFIAAAPLIIAAPDNDDAGGKAGQEWMRLFPSAVRVPAVGAKDIGDMHRAALSWPLREEIPTAGEWFTAAREVAAKSRGTAPESGGTEKGGQHTGAGKNHTQEAA